MHTPRCIHRLHGKDQEFDLTKPTSLENSLNATRAPRLGVRDSALATRIDCPMQPHSETAKKSYAYSHAAEAHQDVPPSPVTLPTDRLSTSAHVDVSS